MRLALVEDALALCLALLDNGVPLEGHRCRVEDAVLVNAGVGGPAEEPGHHLLEELHLVGSRHLERQGAAALVDEPLRSLGLAQLPIQAILSLLQKRCTSAGPGVLLDALPGAREHKHLGHERVKVGAGGGGDERERAVEQWTMMSTPLTRWRTPSEGATS